MTVTRDRRLDVGRARPIRGGLPASTSGRIPQIRPETGPQSTSGTGIGRRGARESDSDHAWRRDGTRARLRLSVRTLEDRVRSPALITSRH